MQAAIKAAIVKAAIAIWLRTIDVGAQRQGVVWVWVVVCVGPHAAIMARRVRDRAAARAWFLCGTA